MTKELRQHNRAKIVFSTNDGLMDGTTGHPHAKKMNLDTDFAPFTEVNAKWIIDLV